MKNNNLDKYLDITNEEKNRRGMDSFIPLYPMFRVVDDKLYVGTLLTLDTENIWDKEEKIKPSYWTLIDIETDKLLEYNKTMEKDFVVGDLIVKDVTNKDKELSKYIVEKTLQYKEYLTEDIKNEKTPLQKKLSTILGDNTYIDGEKVDINNYLLSLTNDDINKKIDDLVDILVGTKYGSITIYYDMLFGDIIKTYKETKVIDKEKLGLCIDIMNYYYDGVIGIDNFFNI